MQIVNFTRFHRYNLTNTESYFAKENIRFGRGWQGKRVLLCMTFFASFALVLIVRANVFLGLADSI